MNDKKPEIVLIAAVAESNRVIGNGLRLPWHIPADLKRFKRMTSGYPLLMGRRTFESLVTQFGGPLPNRRNVVVSGSGAFEAPEGIDVFGSVVDALDDLRESDRIFIGGGASIYAHFLPIADRLELTLVEGEHTGDVFFPEWKHLVGPVYEETESEDHDGFRFVTYRRRALPASSRSDD